jgi:hypothetical protein
MPTPLTPPTLERVLQGLHESEIRCGIQNEPPAGGITAWIDYGSRTEKATFYGTVVGNRQIWPAADRIAAWLHETALRLFPDSPYAKAHGGLSSSPRSAAQGQVPASGPESAHPPTWIKPQLTRLVEGAPTGNEWLHEIKDDGYRRMHTRLDIRWSTFATSRAAARCKRRGILFGAD